MLSTFQKLEINIIRNPDRPPPMLFGECFLPALKRVPHAALPFIKQGSSVFLFGCLCSRSSV